MTDGWVTNGEVRLHYTSNEGEASSLPLLVVPGLSSTATTEYLARIAEALLPRRVYCISLRGRGRSDTPALGYSLSDHVEDIGALVKGLSLGKLCVLAHSRGVAYAIAFANKNKNLVRGLILLEYPARHSRFSKGWTESFLSSEYGKGAVPGKIRVEALRGIEAESGGEELWDALDSFDFPVLVIRGGAEGHLLKDQDVELYSKHLKHGQVVTFQMSGHDPWEPDFAAFVGTLGSFLDGVG